jgi:RNA polymerase sigma factor (sigma-70 family)
MTFRGGRGRNGGRGGWCAVETVLDRARAGDDRAFGELTDPFVGELRLHCYRILGSAHDAEDVLQETLVAAWRGLAGFEERSSLRSWLYRIATNRCLNALRASARRPPPPSPSWAPEPTRRGEPLWLSPYPDALLGDVPDLGAGPEARYEAKETIALAFVAAVQRLPPRQRAALMLRDVLGFRSGEVAGMLSTTEASVNSALQRARATMEHSLPGRDRERAPLPRFLEGAGGSGEVRGGVRGRGRGRCGGAPDRRRVVHDAAGPAGVPGTGGHRGVPAVHRDLARAATVPAGPDQGERTARVRVLHSERRWAGTPGARADRAHPRRGADLGDYSVYRRGRDGAVRPAAAAGRWLAAGLVAWSAPLAAPGGRRLW